MNKFYRAKFVNPGQIKDDFIKAGFTPEQAQEALDRHMESEVWKNDIYQVVKASGPEDTVHLSIKRIDREPIHDWRHLQQIKNELCGAEREAIEIYPAESRLVDTANQYHLWVLSPGLQVPFGFQERMVFDDASIPEQFKGLAPKSKQRPL